MYREVDSDHFSYFLSPKPLKVVAEVVTALGDFEGRPRSGTKRRPRVQEPEGCATWARTSLRARAWARTTSGMLPP